MDAAGNWLSHTRTPDYVCLTNIRCALLVIVFPACVVPRGEHAADLRNPRQIVAKITDTRTTERRTIAQRINDAGVTATLAPELLDALLRLNSSEIQFWALQRRHDRMKYYLAFSTFSHGGALPEDYLTLAPSEMKLPIVNERIEQSQASVNVSLYHHADDEGKVFSSYTGLDEFLFKIVNGESQLTDVIFIREFRSGWPRSTHTTLRAEARRYKTLLDKENAFWTKQLSGSTPVMAR